MEWDESVSAVLLDLVAAVGVVAAKQTAQAVE